MMDDADCIVGINNASFTWTTETGEGKEEREEREEEEEDARHLRQFRLTEEEFDCSTVGMNRKNYDEDKMYEALLKHIHWGTFPKGSFWKPLQSIFWKPFSKRFIFEKVYIHVNHNINK